MLQVSPLSPLRACASADERHAHDASRAPFALGHVARGSGAGFATGRIGVGHSSARSPSRVTSARLHAIARHQRRPVGHDFLRLRAAAGDRDARAARRGSPPAPSSRTLDLRRVGVAHREPQQHLGRIDRRRERPPAGRVTDQLGVARGERERRAASRTASANARAFSAASGAEMMSVPLAFQPSK